MSSNSSVSVRLLMSSGARMPFYASKEAAGADLCAALPDGPVMLDPHGGIAIIPTGLIMEIPCGFEGQVRPRSGLAASHGVTVLNAPGTIDSDYRGEVRVILINHGTQEFVINDGDRIAQLVIAPVIRASFEVTDSASETAAGNGFVRQM